MAMMMLQDGLVDERLCVVSKGVSEEGQVSVVTERESARHEARALLLAARSSILRMMRGFHVCCPE